MKYLNAMLLLMMMAAFTVCKAQDASAKLTAHAWKLDIDAILKQLSGDRKKVFTKEILNEKLGKNRFIFEKDGTLKKISANGKEEKGSWKLAADGKTLTTINGKGEYKKVIVNTITKLSASELTFEQKVDGKIVKVSFIAAE